jgi:hypothetical protein
MLVLSDISEAGTAEIPEQFTPSLRVLAQETNLDRATVKRHLATLEAAGWVERSRPTLEAARREGERTCYKLTLPVGADSATLGAQDAYLGAESAQTMAHSAPNHGAESAHPWRTVRHIEKEPDLLQITPDQSDLLASPPAPTAEKPAAKKPATKGSRIPADWSVTSALVEWAREKCPNVDGRFETEQFVDYWTAASGPSSTKRDWNAAWKVWMRKAQQQAGRGHHVRSAPPSTAPSVIPTAERCPTHPGQRAATCRNCAADRKAGPRR